MEDLRQNQPYSLSGKLRPRKSILALAMLVALALTYGVLLARPFEYQATVQLLIIQNQSDNQDLLSTLRATEQVGQSLVDVISTSTFYDKVLATDFPIKRTFSDKPELRRVEWQKTVRASISQQSGIITVSVFDPSKEQATVVARGVAQVLTADSQEFHGKPNIIVKVVDDVYTKQHPVRPNLIASTLAAIFFGALAGVAIVALLPNRPAQKPTLVSKPPEKNQPASHVPLTPLPHHPALEKGQPPAHLPGVDPDET